MIDYAVEMGAGRLEVAHTQYYAWALKNRAALIPTREQFLETVKYVDEARERLKGILVFDFVRARSLCRAPQALHGRMGTEASSRSRPRAMCCRVMPPRRSRGSSTTASRKRELGDIWLNGAAFNALSRHELDERAVQVVRPPRDRLRRLPLSGAGHDGRSRRDRPDVRQVSVSRGLQELGAEGSLRAVACIHLSPHGRQRHRGLSLPTSSISFALPNLRLLLKDRRRIFEGDAPENCALTAH